MKTLISTILVLSLLMGTVPLRAASNDYSLEDRALDSPVFINDNSTADNLEDISFSDLIPEKKSILEPSRRSFELNQRMNYDAEVDEVDNNSTNNLSSIPEGGVNPGKAILMSVLIPGAGQVYNGSILKAATFITLELVCWSFAIKYGIEGDDKDTEFKEYADKYWNEEKYREYEYWLATTYNVSTEKEPYAEPQDNWEATSWNDRLLFLPTWFTHALPNDKTQQYYEMIGKYLQQFGVGWEGEYNRDGAAFDPNAYYNATKDINHWYGNNSYTSNYIDMRYDSNTLLKRRDDFFKIVMVNHVLAALDAGFTSVKINRRLRADLSAENRIHGDKLVTMGRLNFTW